MDIYFDDNYGKLYEEIEGGVCEIFEYKDSFSTASNMYIKRPVPWLIDGVQYYDVTTPYGYGGPIVREGEAASNLNDTYFAKWKQYCSDNKIIAEFVRFHLFDNHEFRNAYCGEVIHVSDNVVRMLHESMDEIWMQFNHKVRKNVKRGSK